MGEVVVSSSSEQLEGMAVELETEKKDIGSSEVVRWEKFLPRMVLSVLLVEADDSTRQIIAALLRKCSYRVAAVPDGLMAWETLKGEPHNIDLILTEVELPLISGYALLTLVTEHAVCKNIPVIMMSSQDSISMVLKCMLKGAADFLVKPVRKNELRNLWQHVWRRQTLSAGQIPQNLHKVEASSENNAASSGSSDPVISSQKNKDCSEKGRDAQGLSQMKYRSASNLSNTDREEFEECAKLDKSPVTPENKTGVFVPERSNQMESDGELCSGAYNPTSLRLLEEHACAKSVIQDENSRPENDGGLANSSFGCDDVPFESSSGAIDLIGTLNNGPKATYVHSSLHYGTNKFEFAPQLELSLKRLYPRSSKNQGVDERHALNHSHASAFSWYNSKTLQPPFPASASNGSDSKEEASKSPELSSNQHAQNINSISQRHGATLSGNQDMTIPIIGQSGKAELAYPSPRNGLIPVRRGMLNNISTEYSHDFSPLYYTQSSAAWSPKLAGWQQSPYPLSTSIHSNPDIHDSEKNHRCSDETTYNSVDQNDHQQNNKEPVDEVRHDSPAAGQSTGGLCNDSVIHNKSSAYESFGSKDDGIAKEKAMAQENLNDGDNFNRDGFRGMDSLRSSQREAALTKFRLKRKDRCYEKKVRYQSRKRLAEQRPRVKGQFVRQVQNDSPTC
ncbi:PREDICTED: two-component response regulator-like APRR9 isoform X2 [Populus euphratica]|uniref:Two-component response regulator-like APRR9 isoform X2 n=1 Tax=Populus euphratica TaxID=75702 RepID=A0AAJ6V047_POPEU|nr:PREDICTED: two-component response regulator-like APRR9 isoform X2 [Populus euphratica]